MPRRLLAVLLGALLLSSCRLQIGVELTAHSNGDGEVAVVVGLDADAMKRVGGDLAAALSVDDLTAAGWEVVGPALERDGYTRVRFVHGFTGEADAAALLDSIAGPAGPFRDFRVRRSTSVGRTEWAFTGRLDFSGGLEAFGDAGVAALLDGEPLGQSVEEIEAQLGEPLAQAIEVRVEVRLPGTLTSNGSVPATDRAVWTVGFGERSVVLKATGRERRPATLAAVAVGFTSALLLGLSLRGTVVRAVRRRRAT